MSTAVGGGTTESGIETALSVSVQLDPRRLNDVLIGTPAVRGYVQSYIQQIELTVPAGGSYTLVLPLVDGYVTSLIGSLHVSTTDVAAGVTGVLLVDEHSMISSLGFVVGPSGGIPLGQYMYAQDTGIKVVLTNPSTQTATIYLGMSSINITRGLYEGWVQPLLNAAYHQITAAYHLPFRA